MYIVVTFTIKKKRQKPEQLLSANVFGAQGFLLM